MWIRAKSVISLNNDAPIEKKIEKGFYYFTSGSEALRAYLNSYGITGLKVGVQAFTCPSVISSIKACGHFPVFMDIDPINLSSPLSEIKRVVNDEKVDIVIITHICGIPNPERKEIGFYLDEQGIDYIDDLCQTVCARINGETLESISKNYFYSFYIDKPIGLFHGGMLKSERIISANTNRIMNQAESNKYLTRLRLINKIMSSQRYRPGFNPYSKLTFLILSILSKRNEVLLPFILNSRIIIILSKIIDKLLGNISFNKVFGGDIVRIIQQNINVYKDRSNNRTDVIMRAINKYNLSAPYLSNSNIQVSVGSRVVLMSNNQTEDIIRLREDGYEAGVQNWPSLACGEEKANKYPNSQYVLEHLINVPAWNKCFYDINSKIG